MSLRTLSPEKQRQLVLGLVGALVFLLWLNFFLVPQRKIRAQVYPQVKMLSQQIAQVEQRTQRLPGMREELSALSVQLQGRGPKTKLGPEEQLLVLLDGVAQTARQSGARIVTAKPVSPPSSLVPAADGTLQVPLEVQLEAGYHSMGTFLDRLEQRQDFIVRIVEFHIQESPKDIWKHRARFLFYAYLSTVSGS